MQNIGFWIFSILIIIHFPFFIYYSIYNITSIKIYVFHEMEKFHYWNQLYNQKKKIKMKRIGF